MFAVAPMMDYTDKHARYFLRLIAKDALLYTEMLTTGAILKGDRDYLLKYNAIEHPVALQLGGSDPADLAEAAAIGENYGYDEINLNVGCPSPRVSKGRFGACLMLEPSLVAECIAAMRAKVNIPVTIKCRIGVDDKDDYASLVEFIRINVAAGCTTFIIHARKAWLKGLSPKQNREIPPLQYSVAEQVKRDFPHLKIIVNGGINNIDLAKSLLTWADGVMIGRQAFANPYFLAELQALLYPGSVIPEREAVLALFKPYISQELAMGTKLTAMTRHILNLFNGIPGAAKWRRHISEQSHLLQAGAELIDWPAI